MIALTVLGGVIAAIAAAWTTQRISRANRELRRHQQFLEQLRERAWQQREIEDVFPVIVITEIADFTNNRNELAQ